MSKVTYIHRFAATGALGFAVLVAGCASVTPEADAKFGDAVRGARMAQTINPQASANRDPVMGLDGTSAARALDNYQNNFKSPQHTFEILDSTSKK